MTILQLKIKQASIVTVGDIFELDSRFAVLGLRKLFLCTIPPFTVPPPNFDVWGRRTLLAVRRRHRTHVLD